MTNSKRFGVSLTEDLQEKFDEKIKEKMYSNRSEAIRDLIRDFLAEEKMKNPEAEVVGALTIIYDHEKRGISEKLTDLQHEELPHVISSMHVHLDEHNCMETIALKGKAKEVQETANKIISAKRVKHGELAKTAI
ncbi:nickel-responsive regulator [candidate division MSBL1 archaeon SCGC-AAA259J03]|uniref:Putative nickel-responsive regulator n=1 Tax=candidate division MSBL1 archaeon SCGC-AAA259J03 TaxID=1698269 RepID=A0A656YWQ7_9EURY|nr:nickel-responsive regulator [candidate division MSBL1 archaeon SCGC-AAA259J03]